MPVYEINTAQNPAFLDIDLSSLGIRWDQVADGAVSTDIDLSAGANSTVTLRAGNSATGTGPGFLIVAGDGGGTSDGGTIDLIPGAPTGTGRYGGIGIGRTQSYSITIGKYTQSGTGRTFQTFLRGQNLSIDGGDGANAGFISIATDGGPITIDGKSEVVCRVAGGVVKALDATATLITIGTGSSATNVGITIEGIGTGVVKLVTATGDLQIDSASSNGVRIGTQASGVATAAVEIGKTGATTTTVYGALDLSGAIIASSIVLKKGDGVVHTISPQASASGNGARVNLYAGDAVGANDSTLDLDSGVAGGVGTVFIAQTNANRLWLMRSGGRVGYFGTTPVVQQTTVEAVTNNVTTGGTNGTFADFTDLTTYANSAATIRNNQYQAARKLKQIDDALFAYGIVLHS